MRTLLDDRSQVIRIQKASQMAVSTYCIIWALWLARTKQAPRGIIYWLPTQETVGDFVKSKRDPFVGENSHIIEEGTITTVNKEAQNQGLKFFYNTPTFWRGLKSKVAVKSISADAAVYDELDESEPSQVTQARKRLSFSSVKLERELSTPTIPDYGIHKQFIETDQCHFAFRCGACGHYCILEDYFPSCFAQKSDGSYYRACQKCKSELSIKKGTWVKKYENKIRGYQISQLYSPRVSPTEIMHEFETTEFIGHFYNHVLGIPYMSATDRVTKQMVLDLCDSTFPMPVISQAQTVMGVDVGKDLHVTILKPGKPFRVIFCGTVRAFEDLDKIMLRYNVKTMVIDALPETRKVRELIERKRGKVWMCYYNDNQKGDFKWSDEEHIVTVNRTESLDAGTSSLIAKEIILPQQSPEVEIFAEQCGNVAKVAEDDKETGQRRYAYKKLGPDHYRHSLNYAMIAASKYKHSGSVASFR